MVPPRTRRLVCTRTGTYGETHLCVPPVSSAGPPCSPSSRRTAENRHPLPNVVDKEESDRAFRGGNNLVLRTILGRAPRSLDDYIAGLARNAPTTRQPQETP